MFSRAQRVAAETRENRNIVVPPGSFEMITFRLICLERRGQVDKRAEVGTIRRGRYIPCASVFASNNNGEVRFSSFQFMRRFTGDAGIVCCK